MTTEKNKQYQVIVTLLVIVIIIGLGAIVMLRLNAIEAKENKLIFEETKKKSVKQIFQDVNTNYELFKQAAPWWNEEFAKLTLNHTRDTVEHLPYTVAEFTKYHSDIKATVNSIKKDKNYNQRFHISELMNLFPADFNRQLLLATVRTQDQFFEDAADLDRLYYQILNSTNDTDIVDPSSKNRSTLFRDYFKLLSTLDHTLYELIDYNFPYDISYLGNSYPSFVANAKLGLFNRQMNAVTGAFYRIENNEKPFDKDIKTLKNTNATDTTLTVFKKYTNGEKTLITVHTNKELYPMSDEERKQFLNLLDVQLAKKEDEKKRYYCVNSADGTYYATDTDKKLYPHVLENDDAEILTYYDDKIERYYFLGNYSIFDVYYPGYDKDSPEKK